jgi:hypothetical protein
LSVIGNGLTAENLNLSTQLNSPFIYVGEVLPSSLDTTGKHVLHVKVANTNIPLGDNTQVGLGGNATVTIPNTNDVTVNYTTSRPLVTWQFDPPIAVSDLTVNPIAFTIPTGVTVLTPVVQATAGAAPVITTVSLPAGTVGTAYSAPLAATGAAPITWDLNEFSAALPGGLTLSADGLLSGTPTAAGTFAFTVKAVNSNGNDTQDFSLTISAGTGGGGSSDGGDSGGGGSSSGSSAPGVSTAGGASTAAIAANLTNSGTASSASISASTVNAAVSAAVAAALTQGTQPAVAINLATPATATSVQVTLPTTAVKTLADNAIDHLTLTAPGLAGITLDEKAIQAIADRAKGTSVSMEVRQVESSGLTAAQQATVGGAPVYDISITSGGVTVTSGDSHAATYLAGGIVTVTLPYTLQAGENPQGVVVYYVNDRGVLETMNTTYDAATQTVTFFTSHLSLYMIAYVAPAAAAVTNPSAAWVNPFTDVQASDWYYADVEYALENGLFSGTGTTAFSPNTPMTRAMLVTVLYRLAHPGTADDTTIRNPFADVAENAYYTGAVVWAYEKEIVSGVGGDNFAPEANVTRQDLAVILLRYTEYAGEQFPTTRQLVTFADENQIADYAQNAVQTLYTGNIISGKPNDLFDPSGSATRAEVAAVLHRLAEKTA